MDLQLIAEKLEFDLEDVQMLLDMFLSDALSALKSTKTAIEADDFEEIKNIAHGIKGSASNLMLEDITEYAYEIEQLAKDEKDADYIYLFNNLKEKITLLQGVEA